MDMQRLKTLRELAFKGTMAAVAASLHLSPSAISQQISQLEAELNLTLVERRGRGVKLTEAGLRLVRHAEKILSDLERARNDMDEFRGTVYGEVRISVFPSIARLILPSAMSLLKESFPKIKFIAEKSEPITALNALRGWECDIAFFDNLSLPEDFSFDNLDIFPVYNDEIVVILPEGHRLAHKKTLRLKELAKEVWAIDTRPNTFSDFIFDLCNKDGFKPDVIAHFDTVDVITAFISEGCAITILPRIRMYSSKIEKVVAIPLQPGIQRHIQFAVRRDALKRPALEAVVRVLLDIKISR